MSDRTPNASPLPDSSRPLPQKMKGKPLIALFSFILVLLLVLNITGHVKVDGWSILLFLLAVLPWTLPATIATFTSLADAFGKSNLESIEIGNVKIKQLEHKITEQEVKIDVQRQILDDLALYSMAFYIYDKLKYMCLGTRSRYASRYGEYKYNPDEASQHDLRYLRDHGYLEHFQIAQLQKGENLVGKLTPTEMGRRFVELKEARLARSDETLTPPVIPAADVSAPP